MRVSNQPVRSPCAWKMAEWEDLEARKLYQVLPDREATREGYVRVIDESGEDYICPSDLFVSVRLPAAVVRRLRAPARARSSANRRPIRRAR